MTREIFISERKWNKIIKKLTLIRYFTLYSIIPFVCSLISLSRIISENYVVAWLKDEKYLYVESQAHTEDYKRIVRLSNNSLIIYNASVEDSSNNYKCSILRKPDPIDLIHRLLVEPAIVEGSHQLSTPSSPPQHSYKRIRVIPSRRIETYEGQTIRLGCETDIQPPPEIKWFIEVKRH